MFHNYALIQLMYTVVSKVEKSYLAKCNSMVFHYFTDYRKSDFFQKKNIMDILKMRILKSLLSKEKTYQIILNHFKMVLPISLSRVFLSEAKIEILPIPHS